MFDKIMQVVAWVLEQFLLLVELAARISVALVCFGLLILFAMLLSIIQ